MSEFRFESSPFRRPGRWVRGGFHCHTVNSDGGLSPEETLARYRKAGYGCVGITDHRKVTSTTQFSTGSFVAIDSIEAGAQPDVIGVGATGPVDQQPSFCDKVCALARQGAFTIAAHPTYSAAMPEVYLSCPGLTAIEIFNAYCEVAYANGYATELWDMVLGAGKRIWGVAADDAHLNEKKRYYSDVGHGWVEIWTEHLSAPDILNALRKGAFYSTQGPRFGSFTVEESRIAFECTPVRQVRWRTRGKCGHVEYPAGPEGLTQSSMPKWFAPRGYVRIELVDAAGLKAWSNPFFLESGPTTRNPIY